MILAIETAVKVCSVCIIDINQHILSLKEEVGLNNHASKLGVLIDEAIKESKIQYNDLSAVAVSSGPGSYTGLRIGVSSAKGLCYAGDIPLIQIDTLKAMAFNLKEKNNIERNIFYQPMIDARRMEVYTSVYDKNLNIVKNTSADIIDNKYFDSIKEKDIFIVGGDGAGKIKDIFKTKDNIIFSDEVINSSFSVAKLACEKYKNSDFVDKVYFEPFYFKDFVPGKPKVKGLYG